MQYQQLGELMDYSPEGFTKRLIYKSDKILVFVLNFQPGQTLPEHGHEQSDLLLTVIKGSGSVTVNGQATPIGEGSVVICSGDEIFSLANTSNSEFTVLASLSPNPSNALYAMDVR